MSYLFRNLLSILILQLITVLILNGQPNNLADKLQNHVDILASDSLEGRGLGNTSITRVRAYIIDEFKNSGIQPFNDKFLYPFSFRLSNSRITGNNIIGIIEGEDPVLKDEFIVLGAHYDHLGYEIENGNKIIYNGADDNASGVAGIIEMAKLLNESDERLKRSVLIIAFDAEESGLIGSNKLFVDGVLSSEEVKFMFSFDMIGMYDAHGGVDLNGMKSLIGGEEVINEVLLEKHIKIKSISSKIERRTDTHPFGERGIPAVHVYTGTESPYHKPEDDSHLLDYEGMAEIVNFSSILVNKLANQDELLAIKQTQSGSGYEATQQKLLQFGIRANIGSSKHNYYDEFFKAKSVFAAQVGLYAKINISKILTLQPEILLATEGSKHEMGDFRTTALSVPVNLVLGSPESANSRVYLFTGAYYTYNISGKIGAENIIFDGDYQQEQWGLNLGAGIEVMNIQVGYLYKLGLTNLNKRNEATKIKERGSYLILGYTF